MSVIRKKYTLFSLAKKIPAPVILYFFFATQIRKQSSFFLRRNKLS